MFIQYLHFVFGRPGEKILPDETLIIFNEIQEYPAALNILKYFKEKANAYHVIAAGSLLEAYNYYLIIGAMPECVASWIKYKDPAKISQIQRELIEVYENDFSKHNGKVNSGRILMFFRSIVTQLAKPNEKFMYGAVRESGQAHDLSAILLKADYPFKGPLTENYCLQQLRGQFEHPLFRCHDNIYKVQFIEITTKICTSIISVCQNDTFRISYHPVSSRFPNVLSFTFIDSFHSMVKSKSFSSVHSSNICI